MALVILLALALMGGFGFMLGRWTRKENRELKRLQKQNTDLRVLAAEHAVLGDHFAVVVLDQLQEGK